jgi:hypothetical protein
MDFPTTFFLTLNWIDIGVINYIYCRHFKRYTAFTEPTNRTYLFFPIVCCRDWREMSVKTLSTARARNVHYLVTVY